MEECEVIDLWHKSLRQMNGKDLQILERKSLISVEKARKVIFLNRYTHYLVNNIGFSLEVLFFKKA